MENEKTQLLNTGQMARRLRVPIKWLKAEAETGNIPHLKADNVLLFCPVVVEKLLIERASKGGNNE